MSKKKTENLTREFEIGMVVNTPETETEDSVLDKFLEWVTGNGWICGGSVKELSEETES
ncbi:MAG: hypothetical protein ACTHOF_04615 [Flavisolibacter sp.]|jgi:hypothetical protein